MFSGIVKEIGTVKNLESKNGILELTISSEQVIKELQEGSSVAVNGCCLTVIREPYIVARDDSQCTNDNTQATFVVQATQETLQKTNFLNLQINSKVNLESSLKLGETIDGHLVSGHVDTTGEVSDILLSGENKIVKISYSGDYGKYIAPKGSIAVNGVSLTVIESKEVGLKPAFTLTLIPFTRDNTNLGLLKIGDLVNLEVDLISRYVVNYIGSIKSIAN